MLFFITQKLAKEYKKASKKRKWGKKAVNVFIFAVIEFKRGVRCLRF